MQVRPVSLSSRRVLVRYSVNKFVLVLKSTRGLTLSYLHMHSVITRILTVVTGAFCSLKFIYSWRLYIYIVMYIYEHDKMFQTPGYSSHWESSREASVDSVKTYSNRWWTHLPEEQLKNCGEGWTILSHWMLGTGMVRFRSDLCRCQARECWRYTLVLSSYWIWILAEVSHFRIYTCTVSSQDYLKSSHERSVAYKLYTRDDFIYIYI
jgi:hypothetical protein